MFVLYTHREHTVHYTRQPSLLPVNPCCRESRLCQVLLFCWSRRPLTSWPCWKQGHGTACREHSTFLAQAPISTTTLCKVFPFSTTVFYSCLHWIFFHSWIMEDLAPALLVEQTPVCWQPYLVSLCTAFRGLVQEQKNHYYTQNTHFPVKITSAQLYYTSPKQQLVIFTLELHSTGARKDQVHVLSFRTTGKTDILGLISY